VYRTSNYAKEQKISHVLTVITNINSKDCSGLDQPFSDISIRLTVTDSESTLG
jgi:hypothetical protein